MLKLNVNLDKRSYPIYIETDFSGLGKACLSARLSGKLVVITDGNVEKYYLDECSRQLSDTGFEVFRYVIPAGEKNKNLDTVRGIYGYLAGLKLDRQAALIALGGGVTGDITGFAAATYLRGISFIQVPTTLLAQADSSVGGKVGVDFEGHKNIIGSFYQPRFVYIDVNTLRTLPVRELRSGLAEVIKHGLILDGDFYEYIDYNMKKIFTFDDNVLQYLAKMNCTIKGSVVEQDEKEGGLRAILNFGHTFGHAVETVSDFALAHGECVSVGIAGACRLAQRLEMIDGNIVQKITGTLDKAGLPIKLTGFDVEKVYETMFHDKKVKGGKLNFVLPKGIGEVIQCSLDDEKLIKAVLSELLV
ncbi:MAG: 3-dehydroquinate synthase [Ruminiclostridium sp.]|nr:3-dehydroquinate synthase [Ruminiclostridium sp.]